MCRLLLLCHISTQEASDLPVHRWVPELGAAPPSRMCPLRSNAQRILLSANFPTIDTFHSLPAHIQRPGIDSPCRYSQPLPPLSSKEHLYASLSVSSKLFPRGSHVSKAQTQAPSAPNKLTNLSISFFILAYLSSSVQKTIDRESWL